MTEKTKTGKSQNSETDPNKPIKIAIVGGGISGLYLVWRILSDSSTNIEITLYESADRLGGRIYTQNIPGLPFKAELGAMRFRLSQKLLYALLREFEIPIREFDVANPVYYIRGRRLTQSELKSGRCKSCGAGIPFQLRPDEQDLSPSDLIKRAVDQIIEKLTFIGLGQGQAQRLAEKLYNGDVSQETWETVKKHGRFGDIPLYNIGFWNLLHHFLSNEAFVMLHDLLSLDSILGNWNAAEAIPWFLNDFANNDFHMIPGGMQKLVEKLEEEIIRISKENPKKISIKKTSTVKTITYKDTEGWQLDFEKGEQKSFDKVVLVASETSFVKAFLLTFFKIELPTFCIFICSCLDCRCLFDTYFFTDFFAYPYYLLFQFFSIFACRPVSYENHYWQNG